MFNLRIAARPPRDWMRTHAACLPGLVIAGKEKTVSHTAGRWPPLRYPAVTALACRACAQHVRAAVGRARPGQFDLWRLAAG